MENIQAKGFDRPLRFSNRDIARLLIPLVIEQLLLVLVGMADTVMVSTVGEAAVSGISLVDQISVLLIQVFSALATGGAVVVSQYIGRSDRQNASRAAKQLLWLAMLLAFLVMMFVLAFNRQMLRFIFGSVENDVMQSAQTYFWITAISYPFLGLYNGGAAVFRAMNNSRISLFVSLLMNIINIGGNAILIYVFNIGVAGAAISTLCARAAAGVIMVVMLLNKNNTVFLTKLHKPQFSKKMLGSILSVAVPTGLEGGMFQVGKLLTGRLVASFGTMSIAANAICGNIASFSNVPGAAIGLSMVTVIGQCIGAKDYKQAQYYTRKLMTIAYVGMGALNAVLLFTSPTLIAFFHVSTETAALCETIMIYSCICTAIAWVPSFVLPNMLRATGDAKYTMGVSMASMWLCRVVLAYVLGQYMNMGLLGVWVAMTLDWVFRDIFFIIRYFSGKWKNARVI